MFMNFLFFQYKFYFMVVIDIVFIQKYFLFKIIYFYFYF
jgi:hypothetical protein